MYLWLFFVFLMFYTFNALFDQFQPQQSPKLKSHYPRHEQMKTFIPLTLGLRFLCSCRNPVYICQHAFKMETVTKQGWPRYMNKVRR
jgi:hypothetical protein